jgi:hypothetical protein
LIELYSSPQADRLVFSLVQVGGAAALLALIFGVIPNRLTFAVSTVMSIIATLTLLM